MGKPARPGEYYCGSFTKGVIAINGQFFTTNNPPLSYTLSGTTATISDAGGFLGTADLTGDLTIVSTESASPGVNYCGGKQKTRLRWNGGGIETESVQSFNPPISYAVSPSTYALYRWDFTYQGFFSNGTPLYPVRSGVIYSTFAPNLLNLNCANTGALVASVFANRSTNPNDDKTICGGDYGRSTATFSGLASFNHWATLSTGANGIYHTFSTPVGTLIAEIPGGTGYTVTVTDSTGQIFEQEFAEEPTNFVVDCFDYDIVKEASYACESECPGGTEFECRCETENTLTCYAFNADRSRFEPILETFLVD